MARVKSALSRLVGSLRANTHQHHKTTPELPTATQGALPHGEQDSRVAAQIVQPQGPRGAVGDVLTPNPAQIQAAAGAAGAAGNPSKLPSSTSQPNNTSAAANDNLATASQTIAQASTMAAPAITVTHPANADAMDVFSEFLANKQCFAFVVDSSLHNHKAATASATASVLQGIADSFHIPLNALETTYDGLVAHTPPGPRDAWPAYQKALFRSLLDTHGVPKEQVGDGALDEYFRLYKKTLYAQLHPAPGVLPLMRNLLKRRARVLVAVDPRVGCTKDMAAWLVEHLYLDNFVETIAMLEPEDASSQPSDTATSQFADALKRLDVSPDETVLLGAGGNEPTHDIHNAARREGVDPVVVLHTNDYERVNEVFREDDGVWCVSGLPAVRQAIRMTLHERDRSVDSARM